ncbi:MAG: glutamate--tRNA ligase [Candidatus Harrisonbacteria bacterium CG10_big_fil_rev_8_21_14_0_10_38_8]|uniref:Glutamate--tRNA ligase n=1 Tax=Candidatus Harrisonbacteria bacterium CG10_big_fil_rev_8_21_14_0_10_38_8 TaxID=1974582 RepID=A0A2M6WKU8_9BACT|nr:MAG: glutamate--tRNA ligase [Candidatus Harrisonbacteria bacterium CG10_big_fil_rev_8_21_14_0_10_38_8]
MNMIRVRMAPSPTGEFHIGSARTTLFNYLFARKNKGVFVVRLEDTDRDRSEARFERDILENLEFLGWGGSNMEWYEGPVLDGKDKGEYGPYRQSQRGDIYKSYLEKLLATGTAFYCFTCKEELAKLKEPGKPFFSPYRDLPLKEAQARVDNGESAVIRFKVKPEMISFVDEVRGMIEFDNSLLGDIVIAKSLDEVLYNFAVVVDDELMKITHVIRGEDHINNTPKQIALINSLGFSLPTYAHIPLILNADKSKMSKRSKNGQSALVKDYWQEGYHPWAVVNFLALLGWHPEGDKEFFTRDELIDSFSLDRVSKSGAIFDTEKLKSMSAHYIRSDSNLLSVIDTLGVDFFKPEWREDVDKLNRGIEVAKQRASTFSELARNMEVFYSLPSYNKELLVWKKGSIEEAVTHLTYCLEKIEELSDFSIISLENSLMPYAEEKGRGDVLWPLRTALSGSDKSPGPFEIMAVIGKAESILRLKNAINL